jgi:hypothetical protein
MYTNRILKTVCTFSLLLLTSACASQAGEAFPTGTFSNGDWQWEFKEDGTSFTSGPIGSETGTYTISGDQITITCQCCGDIAGTYSWTFDGAILGFKAIQDDCENRRGVVDKSQWTKTP